jgi:hypothetical protein
VIGVFGYWRTALARAGLKLLDPAQDRPAAHVNASIRENGGDALGGCTQSQVIRDGEQDDVTREAMT